MFSRRKDSKRDSASDVGRRGEDSSHSKRKAGSTVGSVSSKKDRDDDRERPKRHSRSSRDDRREKDDSRSQYSPPASTASKRHSRSSRHDRSDERQDDQRYADDDWVDYSTRDPTISRQRSMPTSSSQRAASPSSRKRETRTGRSSDETPSARSIVDPRMASEHTVSHNTRAEPVMIRRTERSAGKQKERTRAGDQDDQTTSALVPYHGEQEYQNLYNHTSEQSYPQLRPNIPNQFPDQTPLYHAAPYLPGQPNPHGEAADYYGDQGQSVLSQPGVRPGTPIIIGAEPHLLPASAEPAPPEETGAGAAAEFFASNDFDAVTPSSAPVQNMHVISPRISPSASPRPSKPGRPHKLSGRPSSNQVIGATAAAALGASAFNHHHSSSNSHSHTHIPAHANSRPPPSSTNSLYAPPSQVSHHAALPQHHSSYQHEQYAIENEDKGAFTRFVDWWNDYEDVRKMEEYTEFIGVCKYCFDRKSSPWEGPRAHHPHRVRSRDSLNNIRVDKQRRYQGAASDRQDRSDGRHKRNATWLGAGMGAYGVARFFGAGSDSESESNALARRRHASAGPLRRSSRERQLPGGGSSAQTLVRRKGSRDTMTMVGGASSNALVRRRGSRERISSLGESSSKPHVHRSHSERVATHTGQVLSPLTRAERTAAVLGTGVAGAGIGLASDFREDNAKRMKTEAAARLVSDGSLRETFDQSRHRPMTHAEVNMPPRRPGSSGGHKGQHRPPSPDSQSLSSSEDSNGGFLGRVFGTSRRRSSRPSSARKSGRRRSGSSDDLGFDADVAQGSFKHRRQGTSKPSGRPRRSSDERAKIALAGLGTAAAALAAHEAGKTHNRLKNNGKEHGHTGLAPPPQRSGRMPETAEEEAWESASDEHGYSDDSGLAFGASHLGQHPSAHSSVESLSSAASTRSARSGTDKWDWRWDPRRRPSPPTRDTVKDSRLPTALASGVAGAAMVDPLVRPLHRTERSGPEPPTNASLRRASTEPLQHLDPLPDDGPLDARVRIDRDSTPSPKPLLRSRTDSVPLKQPQPVQPAQIPPEPVEPPPPLRRVSFADAPRRPRPESRDGSDQESSPVQYPPTKPIEEAELTQGPPIRRPRKSPIPSPQPDQETSDEANTSEVGEEFRGRRHSLREDSVQHRGRDAVAAAVATTAVGAVVGAGLHDHKYKPTSPDRGPKDEEPVCSNRRELESNGRASHPPHATAESPPLPQKAESPDTTPFPQLLDEDQRKDRTLHNNDNDGLSRSPSPPTTSNNLPSSSKFQVRRPAHGSDSSDDDSHEKYHPDFFKRKRKAAADARDDRDTSDVLADWTDKWSQDTRSASDFFAPEELRNKSEPERVKSQNIELDDEGFQNIADERDVDSTSSPMVPRLNLIAPTPPRRTSGATSSSRSASPLHEQHELQEDERDTRAGNDEFAQTTDREYRDSPPLPKSGQILQDSHDIAPTSNAANSRDPIRPTQPEDGPRPQSAVDPYKQPSDRPVSDVIQRGATELNSGETATNSNFEAEQVQAGERAVLEQPESRDDVLGKDPTVVEDTDAMPTASSKKKNKKASKAESRWASLAALATGATAGIALKNSSEPSEPSESQASQDQSAAHAAEETHTQPVQSPASFPDDHDTHGDVVQHRASESSNRTGEFRNRHVPGSFDDFDEPQTELGGPSVGNAQDIETPSTADVNNDNAWDAPATSKKSKKQKKRGKQVSWETEDEPYENGDTIGKGPDVWSTTPIDGSTEAPEATSDAAQRADRDTSGTTEGPAAALDEWDSQSSKKSKKQKKRDKRVSWEPEDKVYDPPAMTTTQPDIVETTPANAVASTPTSDARPTTGGAKEPPTTSAEPVQLSDDWDTPSSKKSKKSKKQKRQSTAFDFEDPDKSDQINVDNREDTRVDWSNDTQGKSGAVESQPSKEDNDISVGALTEEFPPSGLSKKERKKQKKQAKTLSWEDEDRKEVGDTAAYETGTGSQHLANKDSRSERLELEPGSKESTFPAAIPPSNALGLGGVDDTLNASEQDAVSVEPGMSSFIPAALPSFDALPASETRVSLGGQTEDDNTRESYDESYSQAQNQPLEPNVAGQASIDQANVDNEMSFNPAALPIFDRREEEAQMLAQEAVTAAERSSLLSLDGSGTPQPPHPRRQPSSTAIPLRFRKPPTSPGILRDSLPATPELDPMSSPSSSSRPRSSRPTSTEFKNTKEYRPLYLVESTRKTPDPEDSLPSLPSSNSDSRTPSLHESSDNDAYESAVESPNAPPSVQSDYFVPPIRTTAQRPAGDYLDSGQTTPRATTASPVDSLKRSDYFDLGSSGEQFLDTASKSARDLNDAEEGRSRGRHAHSDSLASNATVVAGGGTAAATLAALSDPQHQRKDSDHVPDATQNEQADVAESEPTLPSDKIATESNIALSDPGHDSQAKEEADAGDGTAGETWLKKPTSKAERKREKKARKSKNKISLGDGPTDQAVEYPTLTDQGRPPTETRLISPGAGSGRNSEINEPASTEIFHQREAPDQRPATAVNNESGILDVDRDLEAAIIETAPFPSENNDDLEPSHNLVHSSDERPDRTYFNSVDVDREPRFAEEVPSKQTLHIISETDLEKGSEPVTAVEGDFPAELTNVSEPTANSSGVLDEAISTALPDMPDDDLIVEVGEASIEEDARVIATSEKQDSNPVPDAANVALPEDDQHFGNMTKIGEEQPASEALKTETTEASGLRAPKKQSKKDKRKAKHNSKAEVGNSTFWEPVVETSCDHQQIADESPEHLVEQTQRDGAVDTGASFEDQRPLNDAATDFTATTSTKKSKKKNRKVELSTAPEFAQLPVSSTEPNAAHTSGRLAVGGDRAEEKDVQDLEPSQEQLMGQESVVKSTQSLPEEVKPVEDGSIVPEQSEALEMCAQPLSGSATPEAGSQTTNVYKAPEYDPGPVEASETGVIEQESMRDGDANADDVFPAVSKKSKKAKRKAQKAADTQIDDNVVSQSQRGSDIALTVPSVEESVPKPQMSLEEAMEEGHMDSLTFNESSDTPRVDVSASAPSRKASKKEKRRSKTSTQLPFSDEPTHDKVSREESSYAQGEEDIPGFETLRDDDVGPAAQAQDVFSASAPDISRPVDHPHLERDEDFVPDPITNTFADRTPDIPLLAESAHLSEAVSHEQSTTGQGARGFRMLDTTAKPSSKKDKRDKKEKRKAKRNHTTASDEFDVETARDEIDGPPIQKTLEDTGSFYDAPAVGRESLRDVDNDSLASSRDAKRSEFDQAIIAGLEEAGFGSSISRLAPPRQNEVPTSPGLAGADMEGMLSDARRTEESREDAMEGQASLRHPSNDSLPPEDAVLELDEAILTPLPDFDPDAEGLDESGFDVPISTDNNSAAEPIQQSDPSQFPRQEANKTSIPDPDLKGIAETAASPQEPERQPTTLQDATASVEAHEGQTSSPDDDVRTEQQPREEPVIEDEWAAPMSKKDKKKLARQKAKVPQVHDVSASQAAPSQRMEQAVIPNDNDKTLDTTHPERLQGIDTTLPTASDSKTDEVPNPNIAGADILGPQAIDRETAPLSKKDKKKQKRKSMVTWADDPAEQDRTTAVVEAAEEPIETSAGAQVKNSALQDTTPSSSKEAMESIGEPAVDREHVLGQSEVDTWSPAIPSTMKQNTAEELEVLSAEDNRPEKQERIEAEGDVAQGSGVAAQANEDEPNQSRGDSVGIERDVAEQASLESSAERSQPVDDWTQTSSSKKKNKKDARKKRQSAFLENKHEDDDGQPDIRPASSKQHEAIHDSETTVPLEENPSRLPGDLGDLEERIEKASSPDPASRLDTNESNDVLKVEDNSTDYQVPSRKAKKAAKKAGNDRRKSEQLGNENAAASGIGDVDDSSVRPSPQISATTSSEPVEHPKLESSQPQSDKESTGTLWATPGASQHEPSHDAEVTVEAPDAEGGAQKAPESHLDKPGSLQQQVSESSDNGEQALSKQISRDLEFDEMLAASLVQAGFNQSSLSHTMPPEVLHKLESDEPSLEFGNFRKDHDLKRRSRTPSPTQLWATANQPSGTPPQGHAGVTNDLVSGPTEEHTNFNSSTPGASDRQDTSDPRQTSKAIEAAAGAAGLAAASLSAGALVRRESSKGSKKSKKKKKGVTFESSEDSMLLQEQTEQAMGPAEPQGERGDPIDEYVKQHDEFASSREGKKALEAQSERANQADEYVQQPAPFTYSEQREEVPGSASYAPQSVEKEAEDEWAAPVTSKKATNNKKGKRTLFASFEDDNMDNGTTSKQDGEQARTAEADSTPSLEESRAAQNTASTTIGADGLDDEWATASSTKKPKKGKKGKQVQIGETGNYPKIENSGKETSIEQTGIDPAPKPLSPLGHDELEGKRSSQHGDTESTPLPSGRNDTAHGPLETTEPPSVEVEPSMPTQSDQPPADDPAFFAPSRKQSKKDRKKNKQKQQQPLETSYLDTAIEVPPADGEQDIQSVKDFQESRGFEAMERNLEEGRPTDSNDLVAQDTEDVAAQFEPSLDDEQAFSTPVRKLSKKEQKKLKKQGKAADQQEYVVTTESSSQHGDPQEIVREESESRDFLATERTLEEGPESTPFEEPATTNMEATPVVDDDWGHASETSTPAFVRKPTQKRKNKHQSRQGAPTEQVESEESVANVQEGHQLDNTERDLEEGREPSDQDRQPATKPQFREFQDRSVGDVAPPESTTKSRESSLFVSPPTQRSFSFDQHGQRSFDHHAEETSTGIAEEHPPHQSHHLRREGSQRSLGLLPGDHTPEPDPSRRLGSFPNSRSPESDEEGEQSPLSVRRRRSRPLDVITEGSREPSPVKRAKRMQHGFDECSPVTNVQGQRDLEKDEGSPSALSEQALAARRGSRIISPAGSEIANTRKAYMRSPASATYTTASGDLVRPSSAMSSHSRAGSTTSNPSLRRVDDKTVSRSISSDLRAAAKRGAASSSSSSAEKDKARAPSEDGKTPSPSAPLAALAALGSGAAAAAAAAASLPADYEPLKGQGVKNTRDRRQDMSDGGVFEAYGDARGSPRSPTRPPSVRKRQSLQVLDLQNRLDEAVAENDSLKSQRSRSQQGLDDSDATTSLRKTVQARDIQLNEKDIEIKNVKTALATLQAEVDRLTGHNSQLQTANDNLGADVNRRYAALQEERDEAHGKWQESSRALQDLQQKHGKLSSGMETVVRQEIAAALDDRNAEIKTLRAQLEKASTQIDSLQRQANASSNSNDDFLNTRDEDYFDSACQQLFRGVQQWVLRFSKFSDNRKCRLSSEVNDEGIETRLDNAMLDGTDVDDYLVDRVLRRDVFMSVLMTMIWEYVFTRYLFGMDREQRQKLKSLEKTLNEVGPPRAVAQWRATTLSLLSRREAFFDQRSQDTDAVVHEVLNTLGRLLPPPAHLAGQVQDSLRNVMSLAVDLSIEMRTQRAEYIMLPPLRPEFDTNGELARKVFFNAALMNEKSGETASNEELETQSATVRTVLFPLVVKRGNDFGESDEEVVIHPAQVLTSRPTKRRSGVMTGANRSAISIAPPQSETAATEDPADMV